MEKIILPTGYLFTDKYSNGELETLSIGDYGKRYNVKADFLGYSSEIEGVDNRQCMPLSEKWVVTLSTQYGCGMAAGNRLGCKFCDVPKIKYKGNVTFGDFKNQLYSAIKLFPDVKYTERLNIHFARMGEPAFNASNIIRFSEWLYNNKLKIKDDLGLAIEVIHPVFTTSCPKNVKDFKFTLMNWSFIKNNLYNGQAGLQLSINSTNENQRQFMFNNNALTLEEISNNTLILPDPVGRKYCLNFALADEYEVDAVKLAKLFDPNKFMVKITPIHNNTACKDNNIVTSGGYDSFIPYQVAENALKNVGFDVLIFIPSIDEEDGLVTCGNLVLSGTKVKTNAKKVNIEGMRE